MGITDHFVWPAPITPMRRGEFQFYDVPDLGELPRVTSILDTYGFGAKRLQGWVATEERTATIEAAWRTVLSQDSWYPDLAQLFKFRVGQLLGSEKASDKKRDQAAEIGTAAHRHIRWWLEGATGVEPVLEYGEPRLASLSFQSWFANSGLKPVRMEQFVYSETMKCAGTIDVIAEDPERGLGIIDVKTGKYIYEQHHYQVGAYVSCARELDIDIKWAKLVRVPKLLDDPVIKQGKGIEIVELGDIWGRKAPMTPEQARTIFSRLCAIWHMRYSDLTEGD